MHSGINFGVKYKEHPRSDTLSTLVRVEQSTDLVGIIQMTLQHLFPDVEMNAQNYCFLLLDDYQKGSVYVKQENIGIIDKNVVQLVLLPNLMAEKFINELQASLQLAVMDPDTCESVTAILDDLSNLLPCRNFATEFIKQGGHEVVFKLVESFHLPQSHVQSEPPNKNGHSDFTSKSFWPSLVACLVELAQYGMNSSTETDWEDSNGEAFNGEEGTMLCSQTELFESVFGREAAHYLDELFSWKLCSQQFLSVLMEKCQSDFPAEVLRDGLKVLLIILINCPTAADFISTQLEPDYIFRLLSKIPASITLLQLETSQPPSAPNPHPRLLLPESTSTPRSSHPNSRKNSFCHETPTLPCAEPNVYAQSLMAWNDIVCIALDMIYAILRRARENGTFDQAVSIYLNTRSLLQLTEYLKKFGLTNKTNGPVRILSTRTSQSRLQPNRPEWIGYSGFPGNWKSTSSCFPPGPTDTVSERRTSTGSMYSRYSTSSCPEKVFTSENSVMEALVRLQDAQFVHLADQMNSSLSNDTQGPTALLELCTSLCRSRMTEDGSVDQLIEKDFITLGFEHPTNPIEDFDSPPGKLGFRMLTTLVRTCPVLISRILSHVHQDYSVCNSESCGLSISLSDYVNPKPTLPLDNTLVNKIEVAATNHSSFPLVSASNMLTMLLCEIFGIHKLTTLESLNFPRPNFSYRQKTRFHPLLFRPQQCSQLEPFEGLYVTMLSVFFHTWDQVNASPEDLPVVVSILREQLTQTLSKNPTCLDEFEQFISRYTPEYIRVRWKERTTQNQARLLQSHPALRELNNDLIKLHELTVREQRLNALTSQAPLDYVPVKGTKQFGRDSQKLEVVLSPDRKSLILRDSKLCTREIWLLVCIDRVTTGVEEKVRKNPERTMVVHMRVRDSPEPIQVQLIARTMKDYNYWMDGFQIILNRGNKSEQFDKDVKRLVDLDLKIRLACLDSQRIPTKPKPIPPDPPEFDFDEE